MKRFTAVTLATLMLLTVFASAASAEVANTTLNSLEIRGPVYNGTGLTEIIAAQGSNGAITMNANSFAAFFYDLNKNVTTETLAIKNGAGTSGRVIGKNQLVYQTTIAQTDYKYKPFGNFSVLGFFADKYIPLKSNDASKLAKLVLDSDDKYTLKTGEKLDLGSGYSLQAKQVDVNGKKVWLEFDKDGQYVDDQIVSTDSGDHIWTSELDKIQGEDNVPVLKVHVNQVFQGAVDSIAQIDGLWLIDYANAMKIETSNEFGKLNDVSINGASLTITNKDTMTLTRDSDVDIGQGMLFKVADSDALRFYVYKQVTDPGVYEVRGQVATGDSQWDATNFAGFFYDLKKNVATESLKVSGTNGGRVIPKSGLTYTTTIKSVDFKSSDFTGSYPVLGFFADEYVPLKSNDASKLAKLVLDTDSKYTLKTGDKLDLGQGYSLQAKQVDVNGKKVWLEFDKDGQYVDDQIVGTDVGDSHVWTSELDKIQGEDNVPVLKVHVNQVFQGAVDSIAQIDGLWLIDYANAMKIETSDSFGKLNNVGINGPTLTITNDDTFTLTRDSDQEIGQGMYFKIADSDQLRYYPYVEKTVGNATGPVSGPGVNATNATTPVTNLTTPVANETTPAVTNETTTAPPEAGTTPVVTTSAASANNTSKPTGTPGFEIVPGIISLLAVVYFVRKNR